MFHHRYLLDRAPDEQPYALHFRNDERTVFGVLRFDRSADNPKCYRIKIVPFFVDKIESAF